MPLEDIIIITSAIGHNDEKTGTAIDPVSAALILADKTDVRRNRVQNPVKANFDIHDRVNYAALSSKLEINNEKKIVQMNLELDDNICSLLLTDIPDTLGCSFENIMQSALHDEGSELFAKYCRSFRKAVSVYSVFFKQEEFAAEKEYRVVFKENDEREIHYREKDGFLLPYIRIELKNACSAVNKITVAPQNHVDLAKEGMEMYARQLGYDAQVCLSKIKLRY